MSWLELFDRWVDQVDTLLNRALPCDTREYDSWNAWRTAPTIPSPIPDNPNGEPPPLVYPKCPQCRGDWHGLPTEYCAGDYE